MRSRLIFILLASSVAVPALAQDANVERRLNRIEGELRAVQRKVFPGGAGAQGATISPEIAPSSGSSDGGAPSTSAVADLTARVDALETQLRTLTGQAEENANRLRNLEQQVAGLRSMPANEPTPATSRPAPPQPQPESETAEPAASEAEATPTASDPAEAAYNAGYRHWDAKRYGQAQAALATVSKDHPKSRWASWAKNLEGRSYLDEGKPATAARIFLANYQDNPKGERAPDSLYFLGQSLNRLNKNAEACKVYEELQDVYGATMRDWVKTRLPAARQQAKCS